MTTSAAELAPLPGPDSPPLPPWPGSLVQLGAYEVFVRRAGTPGATPVVMVHGLGGASTNWTDVAGCLAPHADIHIVDLPGHGFSPPTPESSYAIPTFVEVVSRYVRSLGVGPVHLWGNSLGGCTAVLLAARHPDLVRTLTLVSPALPDRKPRLDVDPRLLGLAVPVLRQRIRRQLAAQPVRERVENLMEMVLADPSRMRPERLDEAADEVRRRARLPWETASFALSFRALVQVWLWTGKRDVWRQAGTITAPVLLVWGEKDRLTPVRQVARCREVFQHLTALVLPDSGHVSQIEHPTVVARAFLDLLAAHPGS